MVAGCLCFAQSRRRTLDELTRRADLNLQELDAVLGNQVRDPHPEFHALWVAFPTEKFLIGSAFQSPEPKLQIALGGKKNEAYDPDYSTEIREEMKREEAKQAYDYFKEDRSEHQIDKWSLLRIFGFIYAVMIDEEATGAGPDDDENADNGFNPLALSHLKSTVEKLFQDEGGIYEQMQGHQAPEAFNSAAKLQILGAMLTRFTRWVSPRDRDREAIGVWISALSFGVQIIKLGPEVDDGPGEGETEDGQPLPGPLKERSDAHRGVWAYLNSHPEPLRMEE
jgi:hypothetical protein